jgi:hypothetical protein
MAYRAKIKIFLILTAGVLCWADGAAQSLAVCNYILTERSRSAFAPPKIEARDWAGMQAGLKKARKIKIAGIVLTCAAPLFDVSAVLAFGASYGESARPGEGVHPRTAAYIRYNNFLTSAFVIGATLGTAEFLSGVPLLVTGLIKEHKYKKGLKGIQYQTGWLPDGNVGAAFKF